MPSPTSYYPVQDDDGRLTALRYQALLQQAELSLCCASAVGIVGLVTPDFCRMVDRSEPQILGHMLWDILAQADIVGEPLQQMWSAIVNQTVTGLQRDVLPTAGRQTGSNRVFSARQTRGVGGERSVPTFRWFRCTWHRGPRVRPLASAD